MHRLSTPATKAQPEIAILWHLTSVEA